MIRPSTTKSHLVGLSSVSTIQDALRGLIRDLGYDPSQISTKDLTVIAEKLSTMAGRSEPWGWRYIHNVLIGSQEPSKALTQAILAVGATVDGIPSALAATHSVMVQAQGNVKPGSIIYGDSRPCDNPSCKVWFVPKVYNQTTCSPECRKAVRKLHRK